MPSRVIVYGIEGKDFGQGEGFSPEVEGAVDEVTQRIIRDLRSN
jgi:Ni,Fe-hydrogenase maturation factor